MAWPRGHEAAAYHASEGIRRERLCMRRKELVRTLGAAVVLGFLGACSSPVLATSHIRFFETDVRSSQDRCSTQTHAPRRHIAERAVWVIERLCKAYCSALLQAYQITPTSLQHAKVHTCASRTLYLAYLPLPFSAICSQDLPPSVVRKILRPKVATACSFGSTGLTAIQLIVSYAASEGVST